MHDIGTQGWARVHGGRLDRTDRLVLTIEALWVRLAQGAQRAMELLGGSRHTLPPLDVAMLRLPDSPVALRALEHARVLCAPWVINHCLRTYLWGVIVARQGRIAFDEELLFVASALHDLCLTETHFAPEGVCFAVAGAAAAARFADDAAWGAERRDRLADAIALHLNVRVGLRQGAEAHLLHEGAALDVIGARLREVPTTTVQAVVNMYPRLGFKGHMRAAIQQQADAHPESRSAFLYRLGFNALIGAAPFRE